MGRCAIDLSIVVPVHNESSGIDAFMDRILSVLNGQPLNYEIIFVDDGSTDGTLEKLIAFRVANNRIKLLSLSRNFGKDVALSAGLSIRSALP